MSLRTHRCAAQREARATGLRATGLRASELPACFPLTFPPAHRLLHALTRALLPEGRCRLCALPSRAPLCSACQCAYGLPGLRRCPRCASLLPDAAARCGACALHPPAHVRAMAWGDYVPPLDRLIASVKFGGDAALARWLGGLLAQRLPPAWSPLPHPPPLVVPVPLSMQRLRQRGYNQAWEIARGLAAALQWPCDCQRLLRVRDGPAQSSLPLARRAANLRGAFVAHALPRACTVLLVDDVMTSGSTAEHACRALLRGGAREVAVAVVLRTPAPR